MGTIAATPLVPLCPLCLCSVFVLSNTHRDLEVIRAGGGGEGGGEGAEAVIHADRFENPIRVARPIRVCRPIPGSFDN